MPRNRANIYKDVGEMKVDGIGMGYTAAGKGGVYIYIARDIEFINVEEMGISPIAAFEGGHDIRLRAYLLQWDADTFKALFPGLASGSSVTFDMSVKPVGTRLDMDAAMNKPVMWDGKNWRITIPKAVVRVAREEMRLARQVGIENVLVIEAVAVLSDSDILATIEKV